ncbi:hypothetical protein R1flu_001201 [Riccia fluitans]|uniref:Amino acid transporter transmembrane domain-containing protein n=1 Tax=Riccia fluitans TaxID=41844 RepID=A0ABD1Y2L4_9MARC
MEQTGSDFLKGDDGKLDHTHNVGELEMQQKSPFDGIESESGKLLDDDGRPQRTGNSWTATAHIITAVIGSGVLSLSWSFAQMGWIAGPIVLFSFALCTWFTSKLLADCYRYPDPVTGKRNYIYMDAVRVNVSARSHLLCGIMQYSNLVGTSIGYTIATATSAVAVQKSNCYHKNGRDSPCLASTTSYIAVFGVIQIFLSQIPNFGELWWLSYVAAVMSFTYATIGLGLGIDKAAEGGHSYGSLSGVKIGTDVSEAQKVWDVFSALGNMAFAYSFSMILIEIEDTIRPPAENKQMKRATRWGVSITTAFYMSVAIAGYLAFGDDAPGNLLTGFYSPYWLVDFANVCIVIHLIGAYQVYTQPVYQFFERWVARRWKQRSFHSKGVILKLRGKSSHRFEINWFRLIWRTAYVVITTIVSMLLPFFNSVLGIIGALAFWPLTVYYPVVMYMSQHKVPRWSRMWIALHSLSFVTFLVSVAGVIGSVATIVTDLSDVKPFQKA